MQGWLWVHALSLRTYFPGPLQLFWACRTVRGAGIFWCPLLPVWLSIVECSGLYHQRIVGFPHVVEDQTSRWCSLNFVQSQKGLRCSLTFSTRMSVGVQKEQMMHEVWTALVASDTDCSPWCLRLMQDAYQRKICRRPRRSCLRNTVPTCMRRNRTYASLSSVWLSWLNFYQG